MESVWGQGRWFYVDISKYSSRSAANRQIREVHEKPRRKTSDSYSPSHAIAPWFVDLVIW